MGNRTHKVHTDTQGAIKAESYNYPENSEGNRLLSQTENTLDQQSLDLIDGETQTLEYNQSGSPKNNKNFSYEYNANQRPIKVFKQTQGNNTNNTNNKELLAEYRYNSFGERIKKVSYSQGKKAKVTYFLYDGHTLTAEIEQKVPKSGGVSFNSAQEPTFNQYIYLNHQPIAKLEQKQLYAIHSDHLGTPRLVTNDKKETVWKASYSPFGKATLETNTITLNLRLPGQYEDEETGTYYNYLRDYDPETGRYITSDPIGLKGGVNTYAYVGGDPLGRVDKLGLVHQSEDESDAILDSITEVIGEQGLDNIVKAVLGDNFNDITNKLIDSVSHHLLVQSNSHFDTFHESIKPVLTTDGLTDLIKGLAVIIAVEQALKFVDKLGGKSKNIIAIAAAKLGKSVVRGTIYLAIYDSLSGGAKDFFDSMLSTGKNLAEYNFLLTDGSYNSDASIDWTWAKNCEAIDNAGSGIASSIYSYLGTIGFPNRRNALNKAKERLSFNSGKGKQCHKPQTKKEFNKCYGNIPGFGKLKLSPVQIYAIEKAVGGKPSSYCTNKGKK